MALSSLGFCSFLESSTSFLCQWNQIPPKHWWSLLWEQVDVNNILSLFSSIHEFVIQFAVMVVQDYLIQDCRYLAPVFLTQIISRGQRNCQYESFIINFTSAKMEFASAIFIKLSFSKYSIKRCCKQINGVMITRRLSIT